MNVWMINIFLFFRKDISVTVFEKTRNNVGKIYFRLKIFSRHFPTNLDLECFFFNSRAKTYFPESCGHVILTAFRFGDSEICRFLALRREMRDRI